MTTTVAPPLLCYRCLHTHDGECPVPTEADRQRLLRDIARFHGTPEQYRVRAKWILEGTR